ncbi:hypothetical protein K474DRAFT_1663508 [Panus rudis PR-1116 ss-1]|nr:hypothetical protein K474DRAFT_1663508 [Panus rudis PR-1116 ss-1]
MTMITNIELDAREHPIQEVTVFLIDQAQVIRTFDVDLKAGDNKIVIAHLPSNIDSHSVRVSGVGGTARLVDVACTTNTSAGLPQINHVKARLEQEKKNFLSQKAVLLQEDSLLTSYGGTLSSQRMDLEEAARYMQSLGQKLREIKDATSALDDKIDALDVQIREEDRKASQSRSQIAMSIVADEACNLSLRLTYFVSGASWTPQYDLHASTQELNSVTLSYRARVLQQTGEDWKDTALKLSTVRARASTIPRLPRYQLKISPPRGGLFGASAAAQYQLPGQIAVSDGQGQILQQVGQTQTQSGGVFGSWSGVNASASNPPGSQFGSQMASASRGPFNAPAAVNPTSDTQMLEIPAIVNKSAVVTTYSVPGSSHVLSDGSEHIVSIDSFPCQCEHSRVAVPRLGADVFLSCKVKNTHGNHELLGGPLTVFVNDEFVCTTAIKDISPGGSFECSLGIDPLIRLTYRRTSQRAYHQRARMFGDIDRDSLQFIARTTIVNKHDKPINNLIIRDALPIVPSNDANPDPHRPEQMKVVLKRPAGLAEIAQGQTVDIREDKSQFKRTVRWCEVAGGLGGEKDGQYEWVLDLDRGQQVTLEAEWEKWLVPKVMRFLSPKSVYQTA